MIFSDEEVFAGLVLILQAMRSQNYAAGTAGWSINGDGSAELNNVTVRGTLAVGTTIGPGVALPGGQVTGTVPSATTAGSAGTVPATGVTVTGGKLTAAQIDATNLQVTNGTMSGGVSLFYSGTPALGNLIGSISATAGTDSFGNTYGVGFIFGSQAGAHAQIDSANNGTVNLTNNAGQNVIRLIPSRQAILLYPGTPALGNLNTSIAAAAGSDLPGNTFNQGITVQNGGTVTAKDAAGNTVTLKSNFGGGLLASQPGVAMQLARNTGDPATIGANDPGGALPVGMGLLLASPSPVVGGLPGTDFAQINMTGRYASPSAEMTIDAGLITFNSSATIDGSGNLTANNIQTGTATVTSSAGAWVQQSVAFPHAFTTVPIVTLTLQSQPPTGTTTVMVTASAVTTTGFTLNYFRSTGPLATSIGYTAIA